MKKNLILLLVVTLFAGGAFFAVNLFSEQARAGIGDNVSGWAWSETIGWISFNSENDHDSDTPGVQKSSISYGVNIDQQGNFSGHAWAETIGWIRFDPLGPYPSQPNSSAKLNMGNNEVSGWARALANNGAWDGWIKLRKHASDGGSVPNYGVSINPANGEFSGWAWGSDVVGWISFNCQNIPASCSKSTYKVVVGPGLFNQPPNASISCTPSNCQGYDTGGLTFNNNSTDPQGPSDIVSSEWDIMTFSSGPELTCTSPSALCSYTTQAAIPPKGNHTMTLTVQDSSGATGADTKNFTILQDVAAGFMCSLNNASWVVCETLSQKISQGEVVFLKDNSLLSEFSTRSEGAASIVSRTWKRDGSSFSTGNNTNPSVPLSGTSNTLTLTVTDSAGRTATKTHSITPQIPLPEWQEISPF